MPPETHMASRDLTRRVAAGIEALHLQFEHWFAGTIDDFARIRSSMADDFTFISADRNIVAPEPLLAGLLASHGSMRIRIRIDNVIVRWSDGSSVLATYEERQNHPDYTAARQSTVLFIEHESAPGGLLWRHVHETWKVPPPDASSGAC